MGEGLLRRDRPVRAVVFDLWQTLVPLPSTVRAAAFGSVCEVLGVLPDALEPVWRRRRIERETTNLLLHLREVGRELSVEWDDLTLTAAAHARSRALASCFEAPFKDGAVTIAGLRARQLGVALISNCSTDVRTSLRHHNLEEWFDAVVLSAEVGLMKPAPEIYLMAAERLGVEPADCLYVGDGSDNELEGAAGAGMTPLLYDPDRAAPPAQYTTISSHCELIDLIES